MVVWKTIEELDGNLYALILGATCILFSVLLRLNTLFQPNSFDVLSWTAFYFAIIKYFKTENNKWLFIGAVVFALGFLNKYNIIFLLIGLLPAILLTDQRNVFTKKELYLSLLLGLLMVSPNLIWQYKNSFPVVHHLKQLSIKQLVNVSRLDFLKSQLFFFIGSFFVIISAFYALIFHHPFKRYKPFFWSFIFTLTVFIYLKAKDYYAIGLYPIYIAFGSVFLSDKIKQVWYNNYLKPILVAIPILFFIPLYHVIFPNKSPEYITTHKTIYQKLGLLRWEDGKDHDLPQDFADMLGWKELAIKVDSIYTTLPNPQNTFILCDNYGQAGAINYYTKHNIVAHSFNADYIDWLKYEQNIVDVVLVKENDDEDKNRTEEISLFDTVYLADKRINKFAREDTISIYVLLGAKVDINKQIKEEAERIKSYRQNGF
ncbi:MAG: hypothetical protein OHK0038_14270 [Flammeovirgaceae bacterium]